ncbi:MAG: hypothetical protein FRX49_02124 [Trebouxia sp. A1-2]|nr:MAG: hypothetical protein FRX49_02124 [Trebouxia sp. A1-2]
MQSCSGGLQASGASPTGLRAAGAAAGAGTAEKVLPSYAKGSTSAGAAPSLLPLAPSASSGFFLFFLIFSAPPNATAGTSSFGTAVMLTPKSASSNSPSASSAYT